MRLILKYAIGILSLWSVEAKADSLSSTHIEPELDLKFAQIDLQDDVETFDRGQIGVFTDNPEQLLSPNSADPVDLYLELISPSEQTGGWLSGGNRIVASEFARSLAQDAGMVPAEGFELRGVVERLERDPMLRESFAPVLSEGLNISALRDQIFPSELAESSAVKFSTNNRGGEWVETEVPKQIQENSDTILSLGLDIFRTSNAQQVELRSLNLENLRDFIAEAEERKTPEQVVLYEVFLDELSTLGCQFIQLSGLASEADQDELDFCEPINDQCDYRRNVVDHARRLEGQALGLIEMELVSLQADGQLSVPSVVTSELTQICNVALDPFIKQYNRARNYFLEQDVLNSCESRAEMIEVKGAYGSPIPRQFSAQRYTELLSAVQTTVQFSAPSEEDVLECSAGYLGKGYFLTAGHCMPSNRREVRLTLAMDWQGLAGGCATATEESCSADMGEAFKVMKDTYQYAETIIRGGRNAQPAEFFDFAIFQIMSETPEMSLALAAAADQIFQRIQFQEYEQLGPEVTFVFSPAIMPGLPVGKSVRSGTSLIYDGGLIRFPRELTLPALRRQVLGICAEAKFENAIDPIHVERRMASLASAYRVIPGNRGPIFRFTSDCTDLSRRRDLCEAGDFMQALGGELDVPRGSSGAPVFAKPTVNVDGPNAEVSFIGIVAGGQVGGNLQLAIGRNEVFVPSSSILRYLRKLKKEGNADASDILAVLGR